MPFSRGKFSQQQYHFRLVTSFQLALLAESLIEGKRQGFEMPPMPPQESYEREFARFGDERERELLSDAGLTKQTGRDMLEGLLDILEASGFFYNIGKPDRDEASAVSRGVLIGYVRYKAGRSDAIKLRSAVERFFKHREELQAFLSTEFAFGQHGVHDWAKYFYLFGVYWTARALRELPDRDVPRLVGMLPDSLLRMQGSDGEWVDSPEHAGPAYGTAMGILSLDLLRETLASSRE